MSIATSTTRDPSTRWVALYNSGASSCVAPSQLHERQLIPIVVIAVFSSVLGLAACAVTVWPVSAWTIDRYASSWVGLDEKAARARIGGSQISEETWRSGEYSGRVLVVARRHHELRLMCDEEGEVIHVSIEITRTGDR